MPFPLIFPVQAYKHRLTRLDIYPALAALELLPLLAILLAEGSQCLGHLRAEALAEALTQHPQLPGICRLICHLFYRRQLLQVIYQGGLSMVAYCPRRPLSVEVVICLGCWASHRHQCLLDLEALRQVVAATQDIDAVTDGSIDQYHCC